MGKGRDLWDDSALINAFDNAMSTYKAMHGKSSPGDYPEKEKTVNEVIEEEPVVTEKTVEHPQHEDNSNNVAAIATENCIHRFNNKPVPDLCVTDSHARSSGMASIDEKMDSCSNQQNVDCNQLLTQYYELEEQKQKVVQQLQQAGYWNHQTPVQYTNYEAHQVPTSDAVAHDIQPACSMCAYHCIASPVPAMGGLSSGGYGCCPAWTGCCSASTVYQCPGCQCPSGSVACPIDTSYMVDPMKQTAETENAVKTGMIVAEKAISSIQKGIAATSIVCEETKKGNDKEEESDLCGGKLSQDFSSETDLPAVLSAWYAAGFHTGRYLMGHSRGNTHR